MQPPHDKDLAHRLKTMEDECVRLRDELRISVQKLQAEKAKADAVIGAIGDPVIIIDRNYRISYQNDMANRLFGDNLGRWCHSAYQGLEAPCPECAVTLAWTDGSIHKTEKVMHLEDGMKYVEIAASPLKDGGGEVIAGIEIVRDITHRKKAERNLLKANTLLKAILDSTTDGILAVDIEGNLLGYNQHFVELWKIPPEMMDNYGDRRALHYVLSQVEDPEAFLERIMALYEGPDESALDLIRFLDGRVFERYSRPLVIDHKNVGRVWSFRDITKRSQDEQERQLLIGELQTALAQVKKLGGLLPICSHCKRIRDDQGYWKQIESYISEHSEAAFSHSICPECAQEHYPEQRGFWPSQKK